MLTLVGPAQGRIIIRAIEAPAPGPQRKISSVGTIRGPMLGGTGH